MFREDKRPYRRFTKDQWLEMIEAAAIDVRPTSGFRLDSVDDLWLRADGRTLNRNLRITARVFLHLCDSLSNGLSRVMLTLCSGVEAKGTAVIDGEHGAAVATVFNAVLRSRFDRVAGRMIYHDADSILGMFAANRSGKSGTTRTISSFLSAMRNVVDEFGLYSGELGSDWAEVRSLIPGYDRRLSNGDLHCAGISFLYERNHNRFKTRPLLVRSDCGTAVALTIDAANPRGSRLSRWKKRSQSVEPSSARFPQVYSQSVNLEEMLHHPLALAGGVIRTPADLRSLISERMGIRITQPTFSRAIRLALAYGSNYPDGVSDATETNISEWSKRTRYDLYCAIGRIAASRLAPVRVLIESRCWKNIFKEMSHGQRQH